MSIGNQISYGFTFCAWSVILGVHICHENIQAAIATGVLLMWIINGYAKDKAIEDKDKQIEECQQS